MVHTSLLMGKTNPKSILESLQGWGEHPFGYLLQKCFALAFLLQRNYVNAQGVAKATELLWKRQGSYSWGKPTPVIYKAGSPRAHYTHRTAMPVPLIGENPRPRTGSTFRKIQNSKSVDPTSACGFIRHSHLRLVSSNTNYCAL